MLGLLSRTHGCLLCLGQRSCQPRHGRATFQDERPERAEPVAAVFHAGCCVNLVDLADDGRIRVLLAEEMKEIGFLNDVVPAGQVLGRAYEAASYVAREVSPASATIAKRQLYAELLRNDVGAAVDDSKQLIGKYMQRPDFAEGVQAMAQRRAPRFGPPGPEELPPQS